MSIFDKHYVIISAHRSIYDKTENAKAQADLLEDLLDLVKFDTVVVPVKGRYKGITEESFAVVMPDDSDSRAWSRIQDGLINLGNKYAQDCLLLVFSVSETVVLYQLNNGKAKGFTEYKEHPWIEISEEDYKNLDESEDFTKIMGRYFIVDTEEDVTPVEFKILDYLYRSDTAIEDIKDILND